MLGSRAQLDLADVATKVDGAQRLREIACKRTVEGVKREREREEGEREKREERREEGEREKREERREKRETK